MAQRVVHPSIEFLDLIQVPFSCERSLGIPPSNESKCVPENGTGWGGGHVQVWGVFCHWAMGLKIKGLADWDLGQVYEFPVTWSNFYLPQHHAFTTDPTRGVTGIIPVGLAPGEFNTT